MFNKFKVFLLSISSINENEWRLIESKLKHNSYQKNDILLHCGTVCTKIILLTDGISRMYYFNENAKEFTCNISFADSENIIESFTVDYHSFITQTPSLYSIEALQDLETIELNFNDFQELSSKIDFFQQLNSKINQYIHTTIRDDLIELNTLSNEKRYKYFIEKYEKIHKKIPQYIIASYLGITPVALSRLKSK